MKKRKVRGLRFMLGVCVGAGLAMCGSVRAEQKPDAGKFMLNIRGASAGTDTFTSDANGNSNGDVAISIGGNAQKYHIAIKANKGVITSLTTDAGGGNKFTLTVHGSKGTLTAGGEPAKSVSLPMPFLPFGNFAPHLLDYALASYNTAKGGAQKITFVFAERLPPTGPAHIEGTLTSQGAKKLTHAGKPLTLTRYALSVIGPQGNVDITLLANKDGHLVLWSVPAQQYTAVRAGYEDLLKSL